jgi:hypothetical protein
MLRGDGDYGFHVQGSNENGLNKQMQFSYLSLFFMNNNNLLKKKRQSPHTQRYIRMTATHKSSKI